jgi:hypothetical protein
LNWRKENYVVRVFHWPTAPNFGKNMVGNIITLFVLSMSTLFAHSPHCKHKLPELYTKWVGTTQETHFIRAAYLKPHIFSIFNPTDFEKYQLPSGSISYRNNPELSVSTQELSSAIEHAVQELREGKTPTQFAVLKDKEFNRKNVSGSLILKSKAHPFVVKIFIENPRSFLTPYENGFQHAVMHRITGGVNRYLAGFSRIENLERVKSQVAQLNIPMELDFPRKWYWKSSAAPWFEVRGAQFDGKEYRMELPSVYAVVADHIESSHTVADMRRLHRRNMFAIFKAYDFEIDPNTKNFVIEDSSQKMVLIDTEHFPTVIGQKIRASGYSALYMKLGRIGLSKGFNNPKPKTLVSNAISLQQNAN